MGSAFGNDWVGSDNIFLMKYEFSIKTDCLSCLACLGVLQEFIKKIPGVLDAQFDSETGKIIIKYKGKLSREELVKVIKEKTSYELQ